jgi:hypothetical protein
MDSNDNPSASPKARSSSSAEIVDSSTTKTSMDAAELAEIVDGEESTREEGGSSTSMDAASSSRRPLEFRTGSPGYWTMILLPCALYLSDRKLTRQTLAAIMIFVWNSILLGILHKFKYDLNSTLDRLKMMNFMASGLGLAYISATGGTYVINNCIIMSHNMR